jgi:predicted nucleic acid-binding protein
MTEIKFPIKIFFDSDVMIAGSGSSSGASHFLLQLAEAGIIEGIISKQVVLECRRNIKNKLPEALPIFDKIISRSVSIRNHPSLQTISDLKGQAHPKDISILASAIEVQAQFFLTFNIKHYNPSPQTRLEIIKPGELLERIRGTFRLI